MDIRQLRSLVMLVETGFSVSRAAERLHLVQPAVSQHVRQLEEELGVRLFVRKGKRLTGLTDAGARIAQHAVRTLVEADNILAVGRDHVAEQAGVLRIGTTHTQARYVLPPVIRQFMAEYPEVELEIYQSTPQRLVEMLARDAVDLAICTELLDSRPELQAVPAYRWNRCLIARPEHPLLERRPLTLEALCQYPLITYVVGFTGRRRLNDTFAKLGLAPRVVLSATDADVIKTYVREGLGIGIIADLAYDAAQDQDLGWRDLSHLFPWEVTKIAHLRDKYLRHFQQRFIQVFQASTPAILGNRKVPP